MAMTNSQRSPKARISRPGSRIDAASPPPISEQSTALGQLIDGRASPSFTEDDRPPSGFSKVKGLRAINTPSAPIHVDRRFYPRDMRGLLEIYEQGYTLQEGMKSHCKSTSDALDGLAANCESSVKVLLNQMENILNMIQTQVEKPANVDWTPVMTALTKLDDIQPEAIGRKVESYLAEHRIKMTELEERMEQKLTARLLSVETSAQGRDVEQRSELAQLREELKGVQRNCFGVGEVVRHADDHLTQVVDNEHRALKSDFAQTMQDVMRLQEKSRRADLASVEPKLELQLTTCFREPLSTLRSSVANKFQEVLDLQEEHGKQIANVEPVFRTHLVKQFENAKKEDEIPRAQIKEMHRIVHDDVAHLFNEIGLVQRALNLDYVAKPRRVQSAREGTRLREFWTQTESVPFKDGGAQTEETMLNKHRKHPKDDKKKLQVPKAVAAHVQQKAYEKKKSGYGDYEKKRQKMREALIRPSYNVANYYHTNGCAQSIARSHAFETLTFLFIVLNAIWIAVDTDYNDAVVLIDADIIFQVIENAFCSYFSLELFIRFLAFRHKRNCLRDTWFVFDMLLVLGMIAETWVISGMMLFMNRSESGASGVGNLSILRMARLVKMLRMARMARLLRMVPELVIILKSIGAAFRSISFFLLLTVILIYVYAVGFVQITKDSKVGDQYFPSVPQAMNSLLLDGMLPLYALIVRDVSAGSPFYWPLIMSFICLASVTVMNMLVGVLVEVVRKVAQREEEAMTVIHVTNELRAVMYDFINSRQNSNVMKKRGSYMGMSMVKSLRASERCEDDIPDLTKDVLEAFLLDHHVVSLLSEVGVDALAFMDCVDTIWEEKVKPEAKGIRFVDFVEVVLNHRGTNPASVKDMKENMRKMKALAADQEAKTNKLVIEQLGKLRMDVLTQMNELRKVVDSECGSDVDTSALDWAAGLESLHPGLHPGGGDPHEVAVGPEDDASGVSDSMAVDAYD